MQFEVSREEDLEGGCRALFDKGMVPVRRLLDSLGECDVVYVVCFVCFVCLLRNVFSHHFDYSFVFANRFLLPREELVGVTRLREG